MHHFANPANHPTAPIQIQIALKGGEVDANFKEKFLHSPAETIAMEMFKTNEHKSPLSS